MGFRFASFCGGTGKGCGNCGTTICVSTCSPSLPVYGALVQVWTDSSRSTLVASCTTGSNGCCQVSASGSLYVTVTISGSIVYAATRTLSGTVTISLNSSSAGVVCCGGYAIPNTLTLTDAAGSLTFAFCSTCSGTVWTGGHSVQAVSSTVTTPNNTCLVASPSTGPVRICYQMICRAGQNPTFSVQRSWSYVYQAGTLTPTWYQDSSGFAPGQTCTTAPPPICGNPLTDTASFAANPSSSSPFALSGTPAAAASNQTADPVGGSVAISA